MGGPRRAAAILLAALACFAQRAFPGEAAFSEVWAYLLDGEEKHFSPSLPVTDLGYFGAGIDSQGRLAGVPDRAKLGAYGGRVHLVVAEIGNFALTHFVLEPSLPLRDQLIVDIALAARPFDGVQIDFEAVGKRDREGFVEFLRLLKAVLGDKTLSVALAARKDEKGDGLGYERIGKLADRVVVMAYDEHWSTSEPGPVASLGWCSAIAAYATSKVAPERLVMGLPFYGRAWTDKSLARAYKYSVLEGLLAEKGGLEVRIQDGSPFVEYSESVNVKLFFDDAASTMGRLDLYRAARVRNVAFWRLGQEDPSIWALLAPGGAGTAGAGSAGAGAADAAPAPSPEAAAR